MISQCSVVKGGVRYSAIHLPGPLSAKTVPLANEGRAEAVPAGRLIKWLIH